jgi:hypothetical protein
MSHPRLKGLELLAALSRIVQGKLQFLLCT